MTVMDDTSASDGGAISADARRATAQTIAIIATSDIANFRGWFIRDLAAAGHRVVACAPYRADLADTIAGYGGEYCPISMDRTGLNPFRDARDIVALAGSLRRIRPDVTLSSFTKPNLIGTLAARLAGVPRIYAMVAGLGYAFTPGPGIKRRLLRALLTGLFGFAFRSCRAVFVHNADDEHFVRQAGLVGRRQEVIRLDGSGIDIDAFAFSPPDVATPRVLLIARLLREKGVLEFAEAARLVKQRFPACRFQILGPFDSNPGAISRAEVEAWEAEGSVEYLGETRDVRPYLRACTIYALPSYREGMPRTVLEALAIGRAVVTTDVPGCRETIVEGVNGHLVPPRDPQALAAAIISMLEDPDQITRMGQEGRRIAEARFDVRRVNSRMMEAMGLSAARTGRTVAGGGRRA